MIEEDNLHHNRHYRKFLVSKNRKEKPMDFMEAHRKIKEYQKMILTLEVDILHLNNDIRIKEEQIRSHEGKITQIREAWRESERLFLVKEQPNET